jgi:hypothetical protein
VKLLGILSVSSFLLCAGGVVASPHISESLASEFLHFLQGGNHSMLELTALEGARQGSLEHIIVATGIHCLEPALDESYHRAQFLVSSADRTYRQVFTFTVSPAWRHSRAPESFRELLNGRVVTQHYAWAEVPAGTIGGTVISFQSRSPAEACMALSANYAFKRTAGRIHRVS